MSKIGYARVSTVEQNLDLQLDALKAAGCEHVYSDKASGKNMQRPELEHCLKALRAGDVLVVWRLDRLGRNLAELVSLVTDLGSKSVGFVSLSESIDATGAAGRLVMSLFAAFAEFERNLIRERTMAGLAAARARGRVGGRKKSLTAAQEDQIRALLRDRSVSVTAIAEQYGISRTTLYKYAPSREGGSMQRGTDVITPAQLNALAAGVKPADALRGVSPDVHLAAVRKSRAENERLIAEKIANQNLELKK